jgi:bifunctional non-homologous end joining protein LigD
MRPSDEIRRRLAELKAPRQPLSAGEVRVMLAEMRDEPFSGPDWIFELKHDGFRLLAAREDGQPQLAYRRGNDSTHAFPEVARAMAALPYGDLILDGEVVVLDESGRPTFQGMQKRVQLLRRADIERAAAQRPATLFAFDLLAFEGYDLRPLPLLERKALLAQLVPESGPLRYADHVAEQGEAFFAELQRLGLEGMVGKRASSPYVGGRSPHWQKVRTERSGDFVIVGFTLPDSPGRPGFGALHLGSYEDGQLLYSGRAGSGFSERQLNELRRTLDGLRRPEPPCTGPRPAGRGHAWVEPRLVCLVRFKEWTEEGLLRQPVFLRLREDKGPEECVREGPLRDATPLVEAAASAAQAAPAPGLQLTNLEKVFWPEDGYTKGDLIDFYRAASPWLLPYLQDRPLVLTRYPDGIRGKSFYQKDAPGFARSRLRTVRLWSESSSRDIEYFVCDDVDALVYLANLGTIPLHVWPSRVASVQQPDWTILDLDPKGAPFSDVVSVARALKELADDIRLPAYVKTSGSTGLHVLVPLGAQCTYEQSRSLAQLMAWVITREHGDVATIERAVRDRGGKVYVDYLQNAHGQLLVAPFSVRPVEGARVSTPLRWSEVTAKLDPSRFTIRTVLARLETLGDPMADLRVDRPDLLRALARLEERLASAGRASGDSPAGRGPAGARRRRR